MALTNGDVDHVAGLLSLREGLTFTLHASQRVLEALAANSIFNVLEQPACHALALPLEERIEVSRRASPSRPTPCPARWRFTSRMPRDPLGTREGDSIGLEVSDPATGAAFHYIPGCAAVDAGLRGGCAARRLVLFDGTLYTDDEMIVQGLSDKTGRRMGHISMSGPQGSIAAFATLGVERRIYVHINNSNPALREAARSARRRARRLGDRLRRHGDPAVSGLMTARRAGSGASAPSAPSATTTSTPSIACCTAASSTRARCRPGRSTATATSRACRARMPP